MGRFKDLTGRRFGKLTVVALAKERRHGKIIWKCQCDCGNKHLVVSSGLSSGHTKSCGCLKHDKAEDIAGVRFGKLTAIAPTKKRLRSNVVWKCRCDCGNETLAIVADLKRRHVMSCGCLQHEAVALDLTNQKYGHLSVIKKTTRRLNGNVVYECRCDCGKTNYVRSCSLKTGSARSCGCMRGNDLTGQKFGRLTCIELIKKGRKWQWKCLCDCGNETTVISNNLTRGHTTSCGCFKIAYGLTMGTSLIPDEIPDDLVKLKGSVLRLKKLIKEKSAKSVVCY